MKILIKDTTREEREEIIKNALSCGGGCENCTACWLGGGDPFKMYQDYIDGKREIREINGRRDLNPGPPAPKAGALAKLRHAPTAKSL